MEHTKEQLEKIFRFIPGTAAMYILDGEKLRLIFYTPDIPGHAGFSEEEYLALCADNSENAVLEEDRPALHRKLGLIADSGQPHSLTFRSRHKSKPYVLTHADVKPAGTCGGRPVIVCSFISNYGAFAANSPGGIFVYSASEDDQFSFVSQNMLDMLGYTHEEFSLKFQNRFSLMVYEEDRARVLREISEQIKNEGDYDVCEYRIEKKDGSLIWVHDDGHYVIDENGRGAFYVVDTDITNSVAEKQNLIQKSGSLESIINNISSGVMVYQYKDGRVSYVTSNRRAEEILGMDLSYYVSGNQARFLDYIHPDDVKTASEEISKVKTPGSCTQFTMRYRAGGDEYRWLRIEVNSSAREDGSVRAFAVISDITRERSTELELEQAEHRYYQEIIQSMLTAAEHSLYTVQMDLTENSCHNARGTSEELLKALSCGTVDEFFIRCASFIESEEKRQYFLNACSRSAFIKMFENGQKQFSSEFLVPVAGGQVIWVRSLMSMVRNPRNGHVESVTFSQDITAAKRRDEIFNVITQRDYDYVGILHISSNQVEFLNISPKLLPKYHQRMGPAGRLMDFDEIRRFAADNWIDGKARDDYMERSSAAYVKARLDERGEFELTVPGHYSDIPDSIMCRKIQHFYLDSRKEEILLIETDVTEAYLRQLREAEQAKAEAQRANDIMDCISSGVSVLYMPDPDHLAVDYVNRQLFRILKYDSIDGLAQRAAQADKAPLRAFFDDGFSVIHPEDRERVRKTFRENFASDRFSVEPYRMPCQNGEYVWLAEEVILRGVTDEHRVFYATFRDVTDEKRMQEELAENYKKEKALRSEAIAANTAKSEFLSRMSHDMRTPLNGIIGMTYITREMDLPQAAQENLQKIDTSSKFLLNLINDVLDMTKAESGKIELHPEPYSMEDFIRYIEAVIRPLCQEKNQDLIIDAEPAEDVVPLMDELRINQIYFNIFSNAVKYTPEGGTILFRLRCRHLENCRVSAESCVSDTGIGMSRDFQKVIFEPFTQEHRSDISEMRGTGLGLSIVKRLVDAMSGRITVTSEPGVGTSFNLSMEFDCVGADTCRKAEADVPRQPGESSGLRGKHVLLCEDHPLNQEIATALLEKMGLKVELAENGQTGLYMFRRSNIGFYDAILMDIRMPVMGGYEASRAIRALPRADAKTVPIIAMTADAFAEDVQKCFDAGMNAHIAKPIDPGKLLSELSSLL